MTYEEFIELPASKKVTLIHLDAKQRAYGFVSDTGKYSITTSHFVVGVNGKTKVNSIAAVTDDTEFFYDSETSKLYIFSYTSTDEVIVLYRFFFSDTPINLSHDLTGYHAEVEYFPSKISIPNFKSSMSSKKGISLVGGGSIIFNNGDGFWDNLYDKFQFDNKDVSVYSYHPELDSITDNQIVFRGKITGHQYGPDKMSFKVHDQLFNLDGPVLLDRYTTADKHYKRRIYGKADDIILEPLTEDEGDFDPGYGLNSVSNSEFVRGGYRSRFLRDVSPGDEIITDDGNIITVDIVISNKSLATSKITKSFVSNTITIKPEKQLSNTNREFQLSGHAIKRYEATITSVIRNNRFEVDSTDGFQEGTKVLVNGSRRTVRRVSGDFIILETSITNPQINDVLSTIECYDLKHDTYSIDDSQFTINNSVGECKIVLNSDAEVNSAAVKTSNTKFYFYKDRNKIWIGTPTIIEVTRASLLNYSDSLGKYFTIYNEKGDSVAYWWGDSRYETIEPDHGADESVMIDLSIIPTSDPIEAATMVICQTSDLWTSLHEGFGFNMETKSSMDVANGLTGTSGLVFTKVINGVVPDISIKLEDLVSIGDQVKGTSDSNLDYHEVMSIEKDTIFLRTSYNNYNKIETLSYKNVNYISDDSTVFASCYGKTDDGTPTGVALVNGPQIIEDLLINDASLGDYIDSVVFDKAKDSSTLLVSLALPIARSSDPPKIKDIVNKINKSISGSVSITRDLNLGYQIIDSSVDDNIPVEISDGDLVKPWSIPSGGHDITRKVIGSYKFVDYNPLTKKEDKSIVEYEDEYVDKYVGTLKDLPIKLYLYNDDEALEATERTQFINSIANKTFKLTGKLSLSKFNIGDKVLLNLKRLFVPIGSSTNIKRIGIITSIDNNGSDVKMDVEDMGSLYTKCGRVVDDSSPDFSSATEEERVSGAYIVDENETINDDVDIFKTNLIS